VRALYCFEKDRFVVPLGSVMIYSSFLKSYEISEANLFLVAPT